jgi:5'-3' exonuclease
MGVPAFFKWLTLRYPQVVSDAIEEIESGYDINDYLSKKYDVNKAMPDIDNFYLDMNGIIHPCCHPQDRVNYIPLKIFFILNSNNRPLKRKCSTQFLTIPTN